MIMDSATFLQINVPPAGSHAPLIIGRVHFKQLGIAVLVVIQLPQLFGELLLIVNQGILMKVWPELLETSSLPNHPPNPIYNSVFGIFPTENIQ